MVPFLRFEAAGSDAFFLLFFLHRMVGRWVRGQMSVFL